MALVRSESGDRRERLPGSLAETSDDEDENTLAGEERLERILSSPVCHPRHYTFTPRLQGSHKALQHWLSAIRGIFTSPSVDIAERFKYDLISSNLLSSSVSPSPFSIHPHPTGPTPDRGLPGELKGSQQEPDSKADGDLKPLSGALVILGVAAFMSHHRMMALLVLLASLSFAKAPGIGSARKSYIPHMFEALDSLKAAGSAWDAAVNDAVNIIESEDRRFVRFFFLLVMLIPVSELTIRRRRLRPCLPFESPFIPLY